MVSAAVADAAAANANAMSCHWTDGAVLPQARMPLPQPLHASAARLLSPRVPLLAPPQLQRALRPPQLRPCRRPYGWTRNWNAQNDVWTDYRRRPNGSVFDPARASASARMPMDVGGSTRTRVLNAGSAVLYCSRGPGSAVWDPPGPSHRGCGTLGSRAMLTAQQERRVTSQAIYL